MNALLVIAVTLGAVSADIGLGYHYKVPQTSYGVPSYQSGSGSSGSYNTGYAGSSGSGLNYKGQSQGGYQGQQNAGYQGAYSGLQSTGYQSSTVGSSGYQGVGSNGFQSGSVSGTGYQASGQYPSTVSSISSAQPSHHFSGSAGQGGYQYQTSGQYQASSQQKYQQNYQIQQQPAQVFKHFYVHAAPEEPEEAKPRNPIVLPAPQKHYKIIFIKTPAQSGGATQIVPVQQQNEEKTIVYVLVKKPEDYQNVVVPKVEQKAPSKPEVYFIKYNSKEDSQAVINNIVTDYNNKGQSVSFSGAGAEAAGASSGSYGGQSAFGSGGSSTVSYSGQSSLGSGSTSTGSYSEQSGSQQFSGLGSSFGQGEHAESGHSSSFGTGSTGALSIATSEASGSNGYDSGISNGFASSTSNYDNLSTISTSQGVPHETYGVPKFKVA